MTTALLPDFAVIPEPLCHLDWAIYPHLDDLERAVLDAARGLQGWPEHPDLALAVGVRPIARRLGLSEYRVWTVVDGLRERLLWPIPRANTGGQHATSSRAPMSLFEMAARLQMARRRKATAQVKAEREAWREARVRAAGCASREREAVVRERRGEMVGTEGGERS